MTPRSRRNSARLRELLVVVVAMGIALPHTATGQEPATTAAAAVSDPRQLGGLWESERFFFMVNNTPKLPQTKEMVDRYAAAMKSGQIIYTAWTSCRPGAFSAMSMVMHSIVILQTEADITISLEEPRMTRRIRLDSKHPRKIEPGYIGDSIGHWEGNTLVVDTIGFNGNFELDAAAQPTSTRLHTVERLTKSPDGKRIGIEVTIDDPEYYSAPFKIERGWIANPRGHQMEYDCMENPRSEEFEHTLFVKELYRPTCLSYQGEGMAPSHMVCGRPEDQPDAAGK
jgi:hypothetical protein